LRWEKDFTQEMYPNSHITIHSGAVPGSFTYTYSGGEGAFSFLNHYNPGNEHHLEKGANAKIWALWFVLNEADVVLPLLDIVRFLE